jgi:photosystem II stability/assembly factor-like uncharacterized protein
MSAATRAFRVRVRRVVGLVGLCTVLGDAHALAFRAQSIGPPGGWVTALAVDPRRSEIVYAGMGKKGLYRSTDGGEHWRLFGFPTEPVFSIDFHPTEPETLFVSTRALMRSRDAGTTWTEIGPSVAPGGLALDPVDPTVMYVGREDCVLRTTAASPTKRDWSPWCGGLPAKIRALLTVPGRADALYASTDRSGFLESLDRGETWHGLGTPPNAPNDSATVVAQAAARTVPLALYAATDTGDPATSVWRTRDGGRHWEPAGGDLPETPTSVVVAPSDPDVAYATLSIHGIFATRDGGARWAAADPGLRSSVIAVDPVRPRTVYVGTYGAGVKKTDDGGATWRDASLGIDASMVSALVVAPWPSPTLFALTYGGGPFASADDGRTWRSLKSGLPRSSTDLIALAPDPTRVGAVYIGTHDGLYVSDDAGATWQPESPSAVTGGVVAVAVDPASPGSLYVGLESGGLLRRKGDGSWVTLRAPPPPDVGLGAICVLTWFARPIFVDPFRPGTISWGGALTRDDGRTWNAVPIPKGFASALTGDATHLYAAGFDGGVFVSIDEGAYWLPAGAGLPDKSIDALLLDPRRPATLYAATDTRVFVSHDRAVRWTALDVATLDTPVLSLALHPTNPRALYIGTEGRGVLRVPVTSP